MWRDTAFNSVVLPEPVPPEIRILTRQRAAMSRNCAICSDKFLLPTIMSSVIFCLGNLRIEMVPPFKHQRRQHDIDAAAIGEPGIDHRARLVDPPANRRWRYAARYAQRAGHYETARWSFPACRAARHRYRTDRSTRISVTSSSWSSGSSGPRPTISSVNSSARAASSISLSWTFSSVAMALTSSRLPLQPCGHTRGDRRIDALHQAFRGRALLVHRVRSNRRRNPARIIGFRTRRDAVSRRFEQCGGRIRSFSFLGPPPAPPPSLLLRPEISNARVAIASANLPRLARRDLSMMRRRAHQAGRNGISLLA